MKKILISIGIFLIVIFLGFVFSIVQPKKSALVKIGEAVFKVEIADSAAKWAIGLSNRDYLAEDRGMLFVFPEARFQNFWMKDTRIPLDIIWIREGKVIGAVIGAEPEPGPDYAIYTSPDLADMVLEVNAGTVIRLGIKTGDAVDF